MPHQYILANLLSRNEGAVGALFLDDSGETVDFACSEFSPYQMRVVGAYLGIYLRQVERFLAAQGLGRPEWLHIEKDNLNLYAMPLPDGYYMVLVQRHPAVVALAHRQLAEACRDLSRELFATA